MSAVNKFKCIEHWVYKWHKVSPALSTFWKWNCFVRSRNRCSGAHSVHNMLLHKVCISENVGCIKSFFPLDCVCVCIRVCCRIYAAYREHYDNADKAKSARAKSYENEGEEKNVVPPAYCSFLAKWHKNGWENEEIIFVSEHRLLSFLLCALRHAFFFSLFAFNPQTSS